MLRNEASTTYETDASFLSTTKVNKKNTTKSGTNEPKNTGFDFQINLIVSYTI